MTENPIAIKPASENNRNDTMEYWRSRATTAEQKILEFHEQTSKLATDYAQHLAHVQRFLTEMYQVMIDPV